MKNKTPYWDILLFCAKGFFTGTAVILLYGGTFAPPYQQSCFTLAEISLILGAAFFIAWLILKVTGYGKKGS